MKPFTTTESEIQTIGGHQPVVFYPAEQWGCYVAIECTEDTTRDYVLACPMFKDGAPDRENICEVENFELFSFDDVFEHIDKHIRGEI